MGSAPFGIAAGDGAVWVANEDANTVSRIDPATDTVGATIPVGTNPIGVALTPGAAWIANHNGTPSGSVMRIDTSSNTVVDTIPVGAQLFCCGPAHMTTGAGAVWVGVPNLDSVVRIDPATDSIAATIHLGGVGHNPSAPAACGDLAASDTAIWIANGGCSTGIDRVDPTTNQLVATKLGAGGYMAGLALGYGSLWFATLGTHFVGRLDPASNTATGLLKAPGSPTAVATGYTSTWVVDPALSAVLRLQPTN